MSEKTSFVSILIPCFNESDYIEQTLNSLLDNSYPKNFYEIIIIDGGSTDGTKTIVGNIIKINKNIKIIDNPKKIQSAGLNIGIKKSRGSILIRADAHAIYDKHFIRESVKLLTSNSFQNVGPFQKSVGVGILSQSISMAMNSFFGLGNAKYRLSDNYIEKVKSVWLGAWFKEKLIEINGFDESLKIAEDFDLNYRLRIDGGEIVASNKIKATYIVRKSIKDLFVQFYKYGFWKTKFLLNYPKEIQIRWFAPPILVISLICTVIMSFSYNHMLFFPLLYTAFLSIGVLINFDIKKILSSLLLIIIYPTLHFSWGIGFLIGLIYWNLVKTDKNIK
jgi:glycosyltransferase involved in cell wall biosynthesis